MFRRTVCWRSAQYISESMPRYPNFTVPGCLRALDYLGTCVFAVTGAMTAGYSGLDFSGGIVVGGITAVGGGTVRDIVFGKCPAFWLIEREYLYMSVFLSACTYAVCLVSQPSKYVSDTVLFCGDTIGLGAFSAIGTMYGIRSGFGLGATFVSAILTCTGGGVIRDTLCRRPVRILHNHAEVYAPCCLFGSSMYMLVRAANVTIPTRVITGATSTMIARLLAYKYDLRLPHSHILAPK